LIDLIYCADGNKKFAQVAIDHGYLYGAQLPPRSLHFPIHFADQDWESPNRERYMSELAQYRPQIATVLDWERWEQLPEVLAWAEDAAQYVETIIIIPKVPGGISQIPRQVGGKGIRLGYSVQSRFGSTPVPAWEFAAWDGGIHLLGGSPEKQMELARYYSHYFKNIESTDGNYAMLMASRYNQFWMPGNARYAVNRFWPTLREADEKKWGDGTAKSGAPYEAFRRSCENIMSAWRKE
jgi:hypothetical protein